MVEQLISAQYEFDPNTGPIVVQDSVRLYSPLEDSYNLKTSLTNIGNISPADTLTFTTEVQ